MRIERKYRRVATAMSAALHKYFALYEHGANFRAPPRRLNAADAIYTLAA